MIQNPIKFNDYLHLAEVNKKFKNLVTAVSYEDRGFSSVKSILENLEIERVLLINFEDTYLDSQMQNKWEEQKILLSDLFREYGVKHVEFECDPAFLDCSMVEINKVVNDTFPNIINITTFPKNYILRLAKEFDNENNIFFYYRSKYRKPTKEELNISIKKILPVEGFEGIRELTAEDLLILVLGYEGHRALSFLSKFSPHMTLPLISIPKEGNKETDDKFYNDVVNCNWNLIRKHTTLKNPDGTPFTISSLNHLDFYEELENIVDECKNSNMDVCISPLGTKAQTLGIYLYWRQHPDTQIIYSVPTKRFDITTSKASINDKYPIHSPQKSETEFEDKAWLYWLPKK